MTRGAKSTRRWRPLTSRQLVVLRAWASFQNAHGRPPTLEEVGCAVGVSKVTIHDHAAKLLEQGLLETGVGTAKLSLRRHLTLAGWAAARAGGWQPDPLARLAAAWDDAPDETRAAFLELVSEAGPRGQDEEL